MNAIVVRLGSSGDDVKTLQASLRAQGFYAGALDGAFGPQTEDAVRSFQAARGIEVDGVVGTGTWTALLDPTHAIVAPPIAKPAISSVAAWGPWLLKADLAIQEDARAHGEPVDPFPVDRAQRFVELESGGNACATGKIIGDHVVEAGLAQTYFETVTTRVHGVTSAELRALCGCEGTSQKGGACTDHARQIHAAIALADMHSHRARARAKLVNANVKWDESGRDFWRAVKLVHALPGMFSYLGPANVAAGGTVTWELYKAFVKTRSVLELQAIDHGTARYVNEFGRVFANCEAFAL